MKKKRRMLFGIVTMAVVLTACGSKEGNELPAPTEEAKTETTATPVPTATPEPEPTVAVIEDTYTAGVLTEESFDSEWLNMRFTCQPGFTVGTDEERELFAQALDGAKVSVRVELLPDTQEVGYVWEKYEELKDSPEKPEVTIKSNPYKVKLAGEEYTGIVLQADYGTGLPVYYDYIVRKKESRIIAIELIYTDESSRGANNLRRCFGEYGSELIYLPEEALAPSPFKAGVVTESGYENEWLKLCITVPKEVTLIKQDMGSVDSLVLNLMREDKTPLAQVTVCRFPGTTVEEYMTGFLEYMKETVSNPVNGETVELIHNQEEGFTVAEIGGQEYVNLHFSLNVPSQGKEAHYDYYSRLQDGYAVTVIVMYEDGVEETKEVLNFFSTYNVKDTYEPGVITELGYASKWCNIRFTTQTGVDFGTQDGLEMYAQCVDGARVEVYTELLPEEYLEISETDYLGMLMDELKDEMKSVEESGINTVAVGGDEYIAVSVMIEDIDGRKERAAYYVRKKESRMIILAATCPVAKGADKSTSNLLTCFGGYNSAPVYVPEDRWVHTSFEEGSFTETGYENEWLNLRITLPEGATLTKYDSELLDSIGVGIEWENSLPFIGCMIEYAYDQTAEEYLAASVEHYKSLSLKEEGYVYSVDEQMKTELLGGQEYKVMKMILSRPGRADRQEEYYCRVQDNYIVYFEFLYEKDSEEIIKEAKSLITTY